MNPLTRIAFVVIVSLPLLFTVDVVAAGATLVLEVATMPLWWGMRILGARRVVFAMFTIGAAALATGIATAMYGRAGGAELIEWGPVHVTEHSLAVALASSLRAVALVMPAVLVFARLDIAELGDALIQVARLPERFVWGAVAGLRLIELTSSDIDYVRFARRARGLRPRVASALMPLLVLSLRRAETLSMAMEARGFERDAGLDTPSRTHYRVSRLSGRDAWVIAVAVVIAVTAVSAAIGTGAWHFVLTG